ncbi:MAG: FAD-binding oxidoreductase [Acidimicrobiales bacterium]
MPDNAVALEELFAIVGDVGLFRGDEMEPFLTDWLEHYHGTALAVVRPSTTEEVSAVVRCCARHGVSVVPQGGNTGLCGGAIPTETPSVVLSLRRMNTIESVDPERFSMTVQAGVTVEAIQDAASEAGRSFAPDWGARGSATIGGAISTNAGGINVLQSGPMRENILGLEVVLADGRVWNGLRALRKDSSGLDLKHLFIGTEGTLGVVTKAVVRLRPQLHHHQTAFAAIADIDRLLELLTIAQSHGQGSLTAFELVPELGVAAVCENFPSVQRPLATKAEWYALIRMSGSEPVTDRLTALLAKAEEQRLVVDAAIASTADQEANIWMLRDELPPQRLFPHGDAGLKLDVAVPIDVVPQYLAEVVRRAAEMIPGTLPYAFGHAGDGNLHLYLMPAIDAGPAEVANFTANREALEAEVNKITWRYGGTISAEHGIGQSLREKIAGQKSDVEFDLMRTVKHALDPDGLFNPGKLLPDLDR